jgi:hypothetical protein
MSDTATTPDLSTSPTIPVLDGRTKIAKRLQVLEAAFITALGGNPSPMQAMLVQRATRNVMLLEMAQARALAGDKSVTEKDIVRLDNIARRSIVDLSLPAGGVRQAESLDDVLASIVGGDA